MAIENHILDQQQMRGPNAALDWTSDVEHLWKYTLRDAPAAKSRACRTIAAATRRKAAPRAPARLSLPGGDEHLPIHWQRTGDGNHDASKMHMALQNWSSVKPIPRFRIVQFLERDVSCLIAGSQGRKTEASLGMWDRETC